MKRVDLPIDFKNNFLTELLDSRQKINLYKNSTKNGVFVITNYKFNFNIVKVRKNQLKTKQMENDLKEKQANRKLNTREKDFMIQKT